jgi:hypothetical protein
VVLNHGIFKTSNVPEYCSRLLNDAGIRYYVDHSALAVLDSVAKGKGEGRKRLSPSRWYGKAEHRGFLKRCTSALIQDLGTNLIYLRRIYASRQRRHMDVKCIQKALEARISLLTPRCACPIHERLCIKEIRIYNARKQHPNEERRISPLWERHPWADSFSNVGTYVLQKRGRHLWRSHLWLERSGPGSVRSVISKTCVVSHDEPGQHSVDPLPPFKRGSMTSRLRMDHPARVRFKVRLNPILMKQLCLKFIRVLPQIMPQSSQPRPLLPPERLCELTSHPGHILKMLLKRLPLPWWPPLKAVCIELAWLWPCFRMTGLVYCSRHHRFHYCA